VEPDPTPDKTPDPTRARRSPFRRLRALDPNVRSLGLVSFVADLSSEIVYPIFPLFVTIVLGAPVAVLGLIEGLAEATASLTRFPFGRWSDRAGRRRAFVLAGYGSSAFGKLILALAVVWPIAMVGRFVDRVGKGMRTAPRDALLAAGVRDEDRGIAFGLHRSMDTMGAVLGPLAALLMIHFGVSYRWIFAIAFVPGVLSMVVIWSWVRERAPAAPAHARFRLRLPASPAFRWMLAGTLLFAAGNSTNTFILLKAKAAGFSVTGVILVYVLYNLTYAAGSLPLGGLSDRIGQFPVVIGGFVVFALVYAGFAAANGVALVAVLFAIYGLYIAATEGTTKALISRTALDNERASAMGFFDTTTGLAGFAASAIGGGLWSAVGPWATFAYGAVCAALAAAILLAGTFRPSVASEFRSPRSPEVGP
jgi:MFS family permease